MPADEVQDDLARMVWMRVKIDGLVHSYIRLDIKNSVNWAVDCGLHAPMLDKGDHTEDPVTCLGCAAFTENSDKFRRWMTTDCR